MNDEAESHEALAAAGAVAQLPPLMNAPGKPWGFWSTLAFTLVLLIVHMMITFAAIIGYVVITPIDPNRQKLDDVIMNLPNDGNVISFVTIVTAIFIPAGCIFLAGLRRGITIREYLGLNAVSPKQFIVWLLAAVAGAGALEMLMPSGELPEFMVRVYESVEIKALLWIAVVIGAPIWEEFLFRGFLFAGLEQSLGTKGTIVFTSLAFGCLHVGQYDMAGVLSTMAVGALLGIARAVSGSLYISIAMHSVYNLVAMIQLVYVLNQAPMAI